MKLSYILFFYSFLFLASCTTTQYRSSAVESSPELKQRFIVLQQKLKFNNVDAKTINEIRSIIIEHKNTDIADDAAFTLGKYYQRNNEPEKALSYFENILNSNFQSNLEGQSLSEASKIYFQKGDMTSAQRMTTRGLKLFKLTDKEKAEVYKVQYNIFEQNRDAYGQVETLGYLVNFETDSSKKRFGLGKAQGLMPQLNFSEKKRILSNKSLSPLIRSRAAQLLGEEQMQLQKNRSATLYLQEAQRLAPNAEWTQETKEVVKLIEQVSEVDSQIVGVILPLSGRHAVYGKKALEGLQLAVKGGPIKLVIKDSFGDPEVARKAVEELVYQDKAIAIVGSLMSKTALAVAQKTNELGVPNISLSQKNNIPDVGPYVFKNALSYKSQVKKIIDLAEKKYGYKKFGILFPNDPYGVGMANAFWDEVDQRNLSVVAAERYPSGAKSFEGPIKRLVGTYFVEERQDEYEEALSKWYEKQNVINARTVPPTDMLTPIVNFDALFIPDGTSAFGQIAPMLAYQDVRNIKFLGTSLWNTQSLLSRSQGLAEGSVFVDTHLKNSSDFSSSEFYKKFVLEYTRSPGIFDIIGYDTGLILSRLLDRGSKSRNSLREALSSLNRFPGAVGPLSVEPNGEILRPMVGLTVNKGSISSL